MVSKTACGSGAPAKHAQVEVGPMENPGMPARRRPKLVEWKRVERVDEKMKVGV
jgi:hypothetical protein